MGGPGTGMIPKGVGAPPPPGMDNRRGKLMCIKVRMLDDSVGVFHLGHKALGQALFDEVCRHLNLLECDYFSLEFTDCYGNRCWLDKDKPILRQITTTHSDARFYFIVKFYTPNPADLVEEYTRYLFALQIKRDLSMGELICNENTAALLASYIVQSDCGDFSSEDYPDDSYLSSARFIPNQSVEFQKKVMENHMKLIGMTPGESDLALLETARRCDYYGVKLHAAKVDQSCSDQFVSPDGQPTVVEKQDVEGTDVGLSVAHMGIRVFHQLQCVSTFSWAKIRKLSFKRRKLLIKLHPESYQFYKETIEFSFESRNECKNFWKKCVEHHAFFRCVEVLPAKKTREGRFFSKGSAFRYHGRTQKQLIDYVREHRKRREPFTRPIKSGLSSSSGDRLSRPAFFDSNHPGYATVSERSVNLIGAVPSSSSSIGTAVQSRNNNVNGVRSTSSGPRLSQDIGQQPTATGMMRKSYFPGERPISDTHGTSTSARNHRHRNSQNYPSNSNAATVNGERMCLSDMESSDVSTMIGGGSGDTMNSRYRQQNNYDFRPLKSSSNTKKSIGIGAGAVVAVTGNCSDIADNSDNDAITSVSLPNVLGDDVQLVCREFELKCECPPKSASGDNFLELHQPPRDYDNISEGSYKLSDNEQRSAHSDIQPQAAALQSNNPVYATTFTAKRVGDVIVKKIVTNTRSTPNTTDDEDPYRERRRLDYDRQKLEPERCRQPVATATAPFSTIYQQQQPSTSNHSNIGAVASYQRRIYAEKRHSSSAPSSYAEYPLQRKLVPIEIDGPNINLDEHRKQSSKMSSGTSKTASVGTGSASIPHRGASTVVEPIRRPMHATSQPMSSRTGDAQSKQHSNIVYTSKGTILQRPKIISDDDDYSASESVYSNVSLTHTPDSGQSHMTIAQAQQIPRTYGAIRPLPGKIITKDNLIITPEGYRERKPKPAVPPKPKNLSNNDSEESTSISSASALKTSHPVVNLQKETILEVSSAPARTNELNRPALISVQSEDHPEIQKCHLFNSDIPYVLTMRNLSMEQNSEGSFFTFKDPAASKSTTAEVLATESTGSLRRSLSGSRSPDNFRRRKSLDLVPKKRLPSPSNFSSQDHSISPTTPESGDVLEYLLRRRSIEKSALAKRGRRGDQRRQTQPVRFNIPPSPEMERSQIAAVSQPNLNGNETAEMAVDVEKTDDNEDHNSISKSTNNVETECQQTSEVQQKEENPRSDVITTTEKELTDSKNTDDFPPPPLPPPPPPPLPPPIVLKQTEASAVAQPFTEAYMQESTETLPYVDESASSRASFASKDETNDKTPPASSSTLRTPTGVLWTDF